MLTVSQCSHALSGSTNRGKKHNIRFESKNINVVFFFLPLLFFFFFCCCFVFCHYSRRQLSFRIITVFLFVSPFSLSVIAFSAAVAL